MITRFNYERRYKRGAFLIETRWFIARLYPPILPKINWWWRK